MRGLVESCAMVAHCPISLARDGAALGSIARYLEKGKHFSLGTGTHPADMVESVRHGRLLSLLMCGEPVATAADIYRAAKLGRADALGQAHLGRLKCGTRADGTIFDVFGCHGVVTGPSATAA